MKLVFYCMFDFKQNTDLQFSFCSAIVFGKLTLFQSVAKVVFSDIIVVSYGKNANNNDDSDGDDVHPIGRKPESQLNSCPTIKFRIVNELHSHRRGAIVDARLKAVATIDAKNCILDRVQGQMVFSGALKPDSIRSNTSSMKVIGTILSAASHNAIKQLSGIKDAISPQQQHRLSNLAQFRASSQYFSPQSLEIEHTESFQSSENMENSSMMTEKGGGDNEMVELSDDIMVQDETYVDKPNLVFTKIHFEPSKHPFFGTSWNASHR